MAIRGKEEETKNGMKIVDNLDGDKKALEEDNVKEVFPDESMFELRRMFDMYMKETGGRINKKKN